MFWRKAAMVFPLQQTFRFLIRPQFFVLYFLRLLCGPARGALKADKCSLANAHSRGSILLSKADFHFGNEVFHITLPMASCAQSWQASACISWLGGCELGDLLYNAETRCFVLWWFSVKCGLFPYFSLSGECVSCYCEDNAFGHKVFILVDSLEERTRKRSGNPEPSGVSCHRTNHAPYPMPKMKSKRFPFLCVKIRYG